MKSIMQCAQHIASWLPDTRLDSLMRRSSPKIRTRTAAVMMAPTLTQQLWGRLSGRQVTALKGCPLGSTPAHPPLTTHRPRDCTDLADEA